MDIDKIFKKSVLPFAMSTLNPWLAYYVFGILNIYGASGTFTNMD